MQKVSGKKTLVLTEQQAKMLAVATNATHKGILFEENSSIKKKVKKIIAQYAADIIKPFLDMPLSAFDVPINGYMEYGGYHVPRANTREDQQKVIMKFELNGGEKETAAWASVKKSPSENRVIDYFKRNLYDQLSVRRGRGPEMYLPGAARILCQDLGFYSFDKYRMRGGDIIKFSKTLMLINMFPDFFLDGQILDSDLNGMNYEQFMTEFGPRLKEFIEHEKEETSKLPIKHEHGYTIVRVTDEVDDTGRAILTQESKNFFNEINRHANDWCICDPVRGADEYAQYCGGGGAMYILVKDGYQDIQRPEDPSEEEAVNDNRPLDEYGLSLICIIVGPDGLPDNITTRWNHQYGGENPHGFQMPRDIQRVTGIDYFSTFTPRPREELVKMHMQLDESKKKVTPQSQVHNRVNAGVMDAVTACGTMEEGAEPESDEFTIGSEGGNNDYFHALNESKIGNFDFKQYFKPIAEFMKKDGLNITPYPNIKLNWEPQDGLFIKTGYYEPDTKTITIFCDDRHPKDILRTFCHEMIHHSQNLDGVDLNFKSNDDVKDNERLEEIESEAYLKGNVYFRKWTEYQNKSKDVLQENSNDRKVNKYIKEKFGLTDFQEIRNKVMEIYEKIPYARIDGGQYMLGIMRLLFDENLPREDYGILNKILYRIGNCTYNEKAGVCNNNLGGLSFEELKDRFFIPDFEGTEFSTAEKQIKLPNGYTITRIDSYDEMNAMCDGEWCISYDESMWYELIPNETVYLVENESMIDKFDELMENPKYSDKFSDIAYAAGEEDEMEEMGLINSDLSWKNKLGSWKFPYDYYGLSRFVVLVGEQWITVYSRYNMPNEFDGDYLTKDELEKFLGVNFNDVFKYVPRDDSNGHYDNYGRWRVDAQPSGVIQENIENEKWNGDGEEMELDHAGEDINLPPFLYHVSPIKNRANIKALGLIPSVGEEYEKWWDFEGPNGEVDDSDLPELVFMTKEPETWLDCTGYKGFDLYKIDTSKLNKKELYFDPTPHLAEAGSYCYGETVPPSAIKLVKTFTDGTGDNDIIYEETKPEDIDLSSFDIKTALNPKFWKNGRLDSRIRIKLLDIADDFIDFLGIDWVKPEDVIITGSLANFNWNKKFSDIDLHIVIDFSKVDNRKDFVKNYFNSQKQLWNDNHKDLKIFGFPVELYVQDKKEKHSSTGVYSLDKDKWITEPERSKLKTAKINKSYIKKKVAEYADIIDELEKNFKDADGDYALRKVSEKADKTFDRIKSERKSGLGKSDNEISNGNIIYKCLRRLGYIDKIFDVKDDAYNKLNSLSEGRTLLKEDQEGDSMKKARRYLVQYHGFSEEKANEFVRINVRQAFSALHHNEKAGKFIFGLTRMLFDENISSGTKGRLNIVLKCITSSDELYNSFDKNLNGLSASELVAKFSKQIEQEMQKESDSRESKKENYSNNYKIIRIDSFEEAKKYSNLTDFGDINGHWCLTYREDMYRSYTNDGKNQIYFCLKDGLENLEPIEGEGCPYDKFGLSMLSIIVSPAGRLLYCTTRWNHLHGGGDNMMNTNQIEELLGVDFDSTFPPSYDGERNAQKQLKAFYATGNLGVFDSVHYLDDFGDGHFSIVRADDMYNIAHGNKILFDGWFDYTEYYGDGDIGIIVHRNDKDNIVTPSGKFLLRSWFDNISRDSGGYYIIYKNYAANIMSPEGKILSNIWFDWVGGFNGIPVSSVAKNGKYNLINTDGKILSDVWFDSLSDFRCGYAVAKLNGKENYIDTSGRLTLREWADGCRSVRDGIGIIATQCEDILGNSFTGYYAIDLENRRMITNKPYQLLYTTYDKNLLIVGYMKKDFPDYTVRDKYNLLKNGKTLILKEWVDNIRGFNRGGDSVFCKVEKDNKRNYARMDGTYVFDNWYDDITITSLGFGNNFVFNIAAKNGENILWNVADENGKMMLPDWYNFVDPKLINEKIAIIVSTDTEEGGLTNVICDGKFILPFWAIAIDHLYGRSITFTAERGFWGKVYTYFPENGTVVRGQYEAPTENCLRGAYSAAQFAEKFKLPMV